MKRIAFDFLLILATGCADNSNSTNDLVTGAPSTTPQEQVDKPSTMPSYPSIDDWSHANENEKARAVRSFEQLRARDVPVYGGPLFVDDKDETSLQTPQDVARRTIVLWAVELRSEGISQAETRGIIENLQLWEYVSQEEKRFLDQEDPSSEECQKLTWRLEAIWVLMWALGYIDELDWPGGMCDVQKLARMVADFEDNPSFIANAKLRPAREIVDAQDLTMRIHWAIRDAYLHRGGMIPEELDWTGDPEYIPVTLSAAVGVVEQRYYVLNWLVKFLDPKSWDDVDTPT